MKLIVVGGFLGAGKTTLLAEAARRLAGQGVRVGLVSNDQAPDLVDTAVLKGTGAAVEEIAGSCFCCNFGGFSSAVDALTHSGAEVVLAEPVGSCTDLVATILRPMRRERAAYELAPLSVLVDASRVGEALGDVPSTVDPDALYIFRKQMEEADLLVVAKADTLGTDERERLAERLAFEFPDLPVRFVSAKTGKGIDAWLDRVRSLSAAADRTLEVDYDRYAHGEAVLGWLNGRFRLKGELDEAQAEAAVKGLVAALESRSREAGLEIGHVKAMLNLGERAVVANLTKTGGMVDARQIPAHEERGTLVLNARVQTSPETMERLARESLDETAETIGGYETIAIRTLSPGRPVPTFRIPVLA